MKIKNLNINHIKIRYSDEGQGFPVVLLHGYLESLEIWQAFAEMLAKKNRVIYPDLPGHGISGIAGPVHSMELMAAYVKELLDHLCLESCILIGHSMGGYVALAFAEKYPEYLKGLSLFHSVPFADTEEKKKNRDREIELVSNGKKELLINTNIPKGFADDNLDRLKAFVDKAKEIGRATQDEGVIAALRGMKERPDRLNVISACNVPFLWILGRKDNYINFEPFIAGINPEKYGQLEVLNHSGHMGFIEEPEKSHEVIKKFIDQCR